MASELQVQTISGPPTGANANKILLGSGQQIVAEAGGLVAPGQVIQVVNGTYSTTTGTSSTSFVTTGFSLTITPKSTSNKIIIMTSGDQYSNTDDLHQYQTIYRNGVNLGGNQGLSLFSAGDNGRGRWSPAHITYVDSPNTTNSVTYEIYFRASSSAGTTYFVQDVSHPHRMVLMEIAA